jgi:putative transposase
LPCDASLNQEAEWPKLRKRLALSGSLYRALSAKDETIAWLLWYNRTRMHSTLNYVSPMQFEQDWAEAAAKSAA